MLADGGWVVVFVVESTGAALVDGTATVVDVAGSVVGCVVGTVASAVVALVTVGDVVAVASDVEVSGELGSVESASSPSEPQPAATEC